MSILDPDPSRPYGVCSDCDADMPTQAAAEHHMKATYDAARAEGKNLSHSIRITNLPCEDRVRNRVASLVREAMEDAADRLESDVEHGDLTFEEAEEAARLHPDLFDEWVNR